MIAVLMGVAIASARDPAPLAESLAPASPVASGIPLEGWLVEPTGAGDGVAVRTVTVAGGDGGITGVTAKVRVGFGDWAFAASVPFATYREAVGRDTALGNLQLSALYTQDTPWSFGVTGHLPLGRAFTWLDEAETFWPGAGLDGVLQWQRSGRTTVLARGSAGLHGSGGVEPFPSVWVRVAAAGAVDRALGDRFGCVAEGALAWWDVSPLQASALLRFDPADGARARAGLTVPFFAWIGAQPAPVPAGIREVLLHVDLTMMK